MNFFVTSECDVLIPGYSASGSSTYALTLRWPFRYFPTSPERFAIPAGKRSLAERSSRCEDQT